jgi:integrase
LSHILSQAIAWAWIDAKPFVVSRLKEENTRINYLTDAQVERLLEAASQSVNPHLYPFIRIGLETSMRKMEILSIRQEHIDLVRRRIFIPKSKTGARVQPITARLVDFLRPMMKPGETWLFPCEKSVTGHVVNIDKAYRQAVKAAGLDVKQVNRHTLRHTAITRLVNAGVPLTTVKNISGHKTLQMVERYTHQAGDHIMAAMDLLEASYQKAGTV